jgi:hypothetical protein
MTRKELAQRISMALGALLCLALAIVLALMAVDVGRWRDAMPASDVRYRVSPQDESLWEVDELVPLGASRDVLAVRDDIDFRLALRAIRGAGLEDAVVSDPELVIRRNEAQARLEAIVAVDEDRLRRSRAAGLLGVLWLARLMWETQDREELLAATVASLRLAIALDPTNDEAKYNLEQAFQRGRGLQLEEASGGADPTPGGTGTQGAGASQPGSGY